MPGKVNRQMDFIIEMPVVFNSLWIGVEVLTLYNLMPYLSLFSGYSGILVRGVRLGRKKGK